MPPSGDQPCLPRPPPSGYLHTYTHTLTLDTTCVLCMLNDAFVPDSHPFKPLYLWFGATHTHTYTFMSQMRLPQNSCMSYSRCLLHIACCTVIHDALPDRSRMVNMLYDDEQAGGSCMCCMTKCEHLCPDRAGNNIEAAATAAVNCMRCCRTVFSSTSSYSQCICRTGQGSNSDWGDTTPGW